MGDIVPNSENSLIEARRLSDVEFCEEVLRMSEKCRKCGGEMEIIERNRRKLIEEVIEVHYRCPKCGYEIIIPEPADKISKVNTNSAGTVSS